MSTTESAAAGITKGIAPYLILAGILGVVYLKRDQIASWLSDTIAKPVTGAISDTWGAVTSPFVSAGQTAGQWWYEHTNQTFLQAQEDQAFFNALMEHSTGSPILDSIVASKTADNWASGPFGLKMTILAQNSNTGLSGALPEQKVPAITYTAEEMSNMSKGKTTNPGTGYVVRGQSLTGADLFEVGPWTKVGIVTIHDTSGDFTQEIWKNPIGGELTVGHQSQGLSWTTFQRVERQYGRTYEVDWL